MKIDYLFDFSTIERIRDGNSICVNRLNEHFSSKKGVILFAGP